MGRRHGRRTTTTQVRDILIGTLVIDIADAKAGQMAWRGMGIKEVDTTAKPEKRDKSINERGRRRFQELSAEGEDVARGTRRTTMMRRTLATARRCSVRL